MFSLAFSQRNKTEGWGGEQKGALQKMFDVNLTVLYFLKFPWPSLKPWSLEWIVNRSQRQASRTWVKQHHVFPCCICKRGRSHVVNTCHTQRQMKPCLVILWRIAMCQELSLYYLLIFRENAPKVEVWCLTFQILHHRWRRLGACCGRLRQQRPKAVGSLGLRHCYLGVWETQEPQHSSRRWGWIYGMFPTLPLNLASRPSNSPRMAWYLCPLSPKLQPTCPGLMRSSSISPSQGSQSKEVSPAIFPGDNSIQSSS